MCCEGKLVLFVNCECIITEELHRVRICKTSVYDRLWAVNWSRLVGFCHDGDELQGPSTRNLSTWKRYNKELMQLFGDLDILSFVRVSRLNWTGNGNWMDSKRKVSQVLLQYSSGKSTNRTTKKTDGGIGYKQILINGNLRAGKGGQETELTGRRPLRRRRPVLDCSAI